MGAISAGGAHACGTQLTGIVRCWGSNGLGQLGDGSTTDRHDASGQLAGALPAFTKVSAGTDHTCALGADNSIWCWGNNLRGQLGVDIFFTQLDTPRRLEGMWIDVAAGDQFTCAVQMDSTLWCWGANQRGQLGDGSLVDRRLPVQVDGTGFTAVAAGADHACARRGTDVACWGNNDDGATLTGDAWTTELREIVPPSD